MQAATPIDIADFLAGFKKSKSDPSFQSDALYITRQAILNALYLKIFKDQLLKQGIPEEFISDIMQATATGLSLRLSYEAKPT
jgi:hypothetical protein